MKLSPYRATARIAWRQAKRAPARSALVIALVGLPIAALVFASTVIATAVITPEDSANGELGTADFGFYASVEDVPTILNALPAGSEVVTELRSETRIEGLSFEVSTVFAYPVPADAPVLRGVYHFASGRAPRSPGEAAVHPDTLRRFGSSIGDTISVGGADLEVTGTVVQQLRYSASTMVIGPGTTLPAMDPPTSSRIRVSLPRGADLHAAVERIRGVASQIETRAMWAAARESSQSFATLAAFGVGGVSLLLTGLIVAAAFAVGVRRQLRSLGLLAAVGGERRHMRSMVLLGGMTLGLTGSVIGTGVGLIGALAAQGSLHRFSDSVTGPLAINWTALAGALLLGTLSASAAALVPSRAAGRMSVLSALLGRLPKPRSAGRFAWAGVAVFGIGLPLTAVGTRQEDSPILAVGLGALVGGLLLSIPLLVSMLGRFAHLLPGAWRLAARDAARHGRRTAAALAAATLALTAGVGALSAAAGEEEQLRQNRSMGDNHILVSFKPTGSETKGSAEPQPTGPSPRLYEDLKSAFPDAVIASIQPLASPTVGGADVGTIATIGGGRRRDGSTIYGVPYLASPDLLRALKIDDAPASRRGSVVAVGEGSTSRGSVLLITNPTGTDEGLLEMQVPAVEAKGPRYSDDTIPRFLVSPLTAQELGLVAAPATSLLLAQPRALSVRERDEVKVLVARHSDVQISTAFDVVPATIALRVPAVALSGLFALAILATGLALVSAESRKDKAILVAVGAPPSTRRKIAGANAIFLTLIAGVLALPAGFVPYAAMQVSRLDGYPVVLPWDALIAMLVIVPIAAGVTAFVGSRAPSAHQLVQPGV